MVSPNATILGNIFGGTHISSVLGVVSLLSKTLYALCFIGSLIAFFVSIAKLAQSASNPGARSRALHDIMVSGICFTLLGGVGLIFVVLIGFMS